MKYIKGFFQLNEAKKDGIDIMDFISTSPEGRDLIKIIGDGIPLTEIFDLKNTGRVWIKGSYGSRSYIIKEPDGRYGIYSLSNVAVFSKEIYDTIRECIRALWTNAVGKKITSLGIKKKDYRDWAEANIKPGMELTINELISEYSKSKGLTNLPDVEKILNNSNIINVLKIFFPGTNIYKDPYRKYDLYLNVPFKSEIIDSICPNLSNMRVSFKILNSMTGKSTIKKNDYKMPSIILAGNTPEEDFERLFSKVLLRFAEEQDLDSNNFIKRYGSNPLRCPILENIMRSIANGYTIDSDILSDVADQIIADENFKSMSHIEKTYPPLWAEIEKKMGGRKSGTASRLGDLGF